MQKYLLFKTSNTQRVVAEIQDDNTILLSKEWRKNETDEWILGKGISFPKECIIDLGEILSCTDEKRLDELTKDYKWEE